MGKTPDDRGIHAPGFAMARRLAWHETPLVEGCVRDVANEPIREENLMSTCNVVWE
jgi:hypothetical protein